MTALMLTGIASAQLKVAILEPVDRAQNVSYGIKLLLRSSLTSAISNTPGYEGYDRVDMASIAGEQDFQRTGNVSDNQIRLLGVATGAAYVLVTEAAQYDATNIIITAKILDVESFGIISSAVLVSGFTAEEMEQSCSTLAARLLKPSRQHVSATTAETTSLQSTLMDADTHIPTMKLLTTMSNGTLVYVATIDERKLMNYNDAVSACACKGEGWRLPSSEEMRLMLNHSKELNISHRHAYRIQYGYYFPEYQDPVRTGLKNQKMKVRCVKEVKTTQTNSK